MYSYSSSLNLQITPNPKNHKSPNQFPSILLQNPSISLSSYRHPPPSQPTTVTYGQSPIFPLLFFLLFTSFPLFPWLLYSNKLFQIKKKKKKKIEIVYNFNGNNFVVEPFFIFRIFLYQKLYFSSPFPSPVSYENTPYCIKHISLSNEPNYVIPFYKSFIFPMTSTFF